MWTFIPDLYINALIFPRNFSPQFLQSPAWQAGAPTGLEEVTFTSRRIIRPAYKNVFGKRRYELLDERN